HAPPDRQPALAGRIRNGRRQARPPPRARPRRRRPSRARPRPHPCRPRRMRAAHPARADRLEIRATARTIPRRRPAPRGDRMSLPMRFARSLGAALAAASLLVLLARAGDLRPSLPPLPQSFSQPLPGHTISAFLDLAAWTVAVLLDLVLLGKVIKFGLR